MEKRKQIFPSLDMYVAAPVNWPRYTSEGERLRREHQERTERAMMNWIKKPLTRKRWPK